MAAPIARPDVGIGEVGDDGARLDAVLVAHLGGDLPEELLAPGEHHHVQAASCRLVRVRPADPHRRPGDQGPGAVLRLEVRHLRILSGAASR